MSAAVQLEDYVNEFVTAHGALPFRGFWRKWVNDARVRRHLCLVSLIPTAEGIGMMRALINKTTPTPQSQNVSREEQPPIQVYIGPGLNLGYGYVDVEALRQKPAQLASGNGNGDGGAG